MTCIVIYSDIADADHDRLYLAQSRYSPEKAGVWDAALRNAVKELCNFPGPFAWAIDEKASNIFGKEVRRLLYHGPTRRRTSVATRILYTILQPSPDEIDPEQIILILRMLHGSQVLTPDDPPAE